MALTTTNAQITIQDGQGAVANLNNAAVGFYTPGSLLSFALQSTTGVAKWKLQFICPAFPSLHLRVIEWAQGQANLLQVQMPGQSSPVANSYGGIQVVSVVDDGVQSIAQSVSFLETIGLAAPAVQHFARVATAAALAAYTAAAGVITANANGALGNIDGVAVAAGDKVLLTLGATASDNGLYIITSLGGASAKFVLTRAPDWATGSTIKSGTVVQLGPEGTAFPSYEWKVLNSGDPVVDTTDPKLYPRVHRGAGNTGGGTTIALTTLWAFSSASTMLAIDNTGAAAVQAGAVVAGAGTGTCTLTGTTGHAISWALINW